MIRAAILVILLALGAKAFSAVSTLAEAREAARVAILSEVGK